MGDLSKFGLLGFGNAYESTAAYLQSRGLTATAWALPRHRSSLHPLCKDLGPGANDGNNLRNNAQPLKEAASLEQLVGLHQYIVIAAAADTELYIAALEELNHLLQDTILLVIRGKDAMPISRSRLMCKYILQSSPYYPTPKLDHNECALNDADLNAERRESSPTIPEQFLSLLRDLACSSADELPQKDIAVEHGLEAFSQQGVAMENGLVALGRVNEFIESFEHIAEYGDRHTPVVTMFSGGLDSSYLLLKLQLLGFTNVHAVAVDVGGPIDVDQLATSAAHFGATFRRLDGRELFVQKYVIPAIRAHAKYMGIYPISSSLSRPIIARLTADYAQALKAGLLLHTANLSQNSLPRINNTIQRHDFPGRFGSPYIRSVVSRQQKAEAISAAGLTFMSDRKMSGDENLWCREFESGPLDDPESFDIPGDAFQWTAHNWSCSPQTLTLGFQEGSLVSVNCEKLPLMEAIALLNRAMGKFGHGRFVGLEPIGTDEKVLEVREAPAATIIMDALRHLEVATLESNTLDLKHNRVGFKRKLVTEGERSVLRFFAVAAILAVGIAWTAVIVNVIAVTTLSLSVLLSLSASRELCLSPSSAVLPSASIETKY
ncbi:hypothetical protein MY1884_009641 [Beauveria asiatica]